MRRTWLHRSTPIQSNDFHRHCLLHGSNVREWGGDGSWNQLDRGGRDLTSIDEGYPRGIQSKWRLDVWGSWLLQLEPFARSQSTLIVKSWHIGVWSTNSFPSSHHLMQWTGGMWVWWSTRAPCTAVHDSPHASYSNGTSSDVGVTSGPMIGADEMLTRSQTLSA